MSEDRKPITNEMAWQMILPEMPEFAERMGIESPNLEGVKRLRLFFALMDDVRRDLESGKSFDEVKEQMAEAARQALDEKAGVH